MSDCLFCSIAEESIPSARVYADDTVYAFLDINPLRPGHALVVPRRHAPRLEEAEPEEAAAMLRAARRIAPVVCHATGTRDATIAINNGRHAGQEVDHLHLHIVPRAPDDGAGPIHAMFQDRPEADPDALARLADEVRGNLEAAA